MKRLITGLGIALAMASLADGRTAEQIRQEFSALSKEDQRKFVEKSITTEEWRTIADYVLGLAATNRGEAISYNPNVVGCMGRMFPVANAAPLAKEYDVKFAKYRIVTPDYYKQFPISGEAYFANSNKTCRKWVEAHPARSAVIRKYQNGYVTGKESIGELSNILAEECAATWAGMPRFWPVNIDADKKRILTKAPMAVKRYLRKTGQSFVQKEGEPNKVQAAVDALVAALDAPRMQGLKEWCAQYCPDYQWVDVKWDTDEEFQKVADAFYYGDLELGEVGKMLLKSNLGIAGYNEWVRKYNGEQ